MQCLADARNCREEWTILCVTYLVGNDCSKLMTKFVIKSFPQSKIWVRIYETISQRMVILTYLLAGWHYVLSSEPIGCGSGCPCEISQQKNGKASVAVVLNYTLGKVRSIPPVYSIELSWLPIVGSVSFFPMTHLFLHSIF